MTNFDDLNDPLDELFGGSTGTPRPIARELPAEVQAAVFVEKCPSCRGSGNFVSYSGRIVGPCFKCKGKGKFERKTSPEARATARAKSAERKVNKAATNWTA